MNRFLLSITLLFGGLTVTFAQPARTVEQAIHYIKLANTLRAVDKSPDAINLLRRALPAVQKNLYWLAVTNELLGLSYNDLENRTTALRYLTTARDQYAKLRYVASAWGVNEVVRNVSGKNLYAGIQIGVSDVKLVILKTSYETDFYEKDIQSTIDIPDVTLTADASNSFRIGQTALTTCLDTIRRYNIPNERVFVVLGTDVRQSMARTASDRRRLYEQLSQVLPGGSIRIDTTLTPQREAELFTVGIIPRKVWPTTSALSIGNASTLGGYFDTDRTFHGISAPVGVNTLVAQIEGRRSLNTDAFRREAQRVVQAVADTTLTRRLNVGGPNFRQRSTVGIGGEVPAALVAYLHPERAGLTAVPITMDDVERFNREVMDDYRTLTRPNLAAIADPAVRDKAASNIGAAQSRLTEKQLIAGALWLEALMKAYTVGSSPKRFVFVRNAEVGWITGKFLETINNEYESTIAKGSLYTR